MLLMALQKGGEKLGYESEAFAIYDTMKYIKPSVRTLCVGTAFGESAMLLAAGEKVCQTCYRFWSHRLLFTVIFWRDPWYSLRTALSSCTFSQCTKLREMLLQCPQMLHDDDSGCKQLQAFSCLVLT